MAKSPERPAHISAGDWDAVDVPEATAEQWRGARPFGDVFPELAKKRGRPVAQAPKKAISFRFSADIVEAIKASKGYNGRIEKLLRAALLTKPAAAPDGRRETGSETPSGKTSAAKIRRAPRKSA